MMTKKEVHLRKNAERKKAMDGLVRRNVATTSVTRTSVAECQLPPSHTQTYRSQKRISNKCTIGLITTLDSSIWSKLWRRGGVTTAKTYVPNGNTKANFTVAATKKR